MKRVLVISALLSLIVPSASANALLTETVSITETGGIVVEGTAGASGSTDAETSVHSVIRSSGGNTNVRVDIRTAADGEAYATSVTRTVKIEEKPQAQDAVESNNEGALEAEIGLQIEGASAFERFSAIFTSFFRFLVFW